MILLDKYVKFLVNNNITERQLLILMFIYYNKQDLISLYKDKFTGGKSLLTEEDKEVFIKEGFATKDSQGNLILSKEFLSIFVDKDEATDQIFDLYPTSMNHQGVVIPLKAMDRNVFANLYQSAIMGSLAEHYEVILDIKYGIENNLLNIGIEKFIKSKFWLGLRKARLENKKIVSTITAIDNNF